MNVYIKIRGCVFPFSKERLRGTIEKLERGENFTSFMFFTKIETFHGSATITLDGSEVKISCQELLTLLKEYT